jgi:hypothetical protein
LPSPPFPFEGRPPIAAAVVGGSLAAGVGAGLEVERPAGVSAGVGAGVGPAVGATITRGFATGAALGVGLGVATGFGLGSGFAVGFGVAFGGGGGVALGGGGGVAFGGGGGTALIVIEPAGRLAWPLSLALAAITTPCCPTGSFPDQAKVAPSRQDPPGRSPITNLVPPTVAVTSVARAPRPFL